jgi:hypothetical protein
MDRREEEMFLKMNDFEIGGPPVSFDNVGSELIFKISSERFAKMIKDFAIELKNNGLIDNLDDERLIDYLAMYMEANR